MQGNGDNVNITDDEFFDRVISGAVGTYSDGLESAELAEKLECVLSEVKNLREQLFVISMANVSDGKTKTCESYNNIMVGELSEIKNAVASLTSSAPVGSSADEIEKLKKTVAEQKETQTVMLELLNKIMKKLDGSERRDVGRSDEIAATATKNAAADDGVAKKAEVMTEIENIKQTINAMQGNDNNSDDDLETSIAKLKAELSQMAGIIDANK